MQETCRFESPAICRNVQGESDETGRQCERFEKLRTSSFFTGKCLEVDRRAVAHTERLAVHEQEGNNAILIIEHICQTISHIYRSRLPRRRAEKTCLEHTCRDLLYRDETKSEKALRTKTAPNDESCPSESMSRYRTLLPDDTLCHPRGAYPMVADWLVDIVHEHPDRL